MKKVYGKCKRMLAFLLAAAMLFTCVPQTGLSVQAAPDADTALTEEETQPQAGETLAEEEEQEETEETEEEPTDEEEEESSDPAGETPENTGGGV